MALNNLFKDEYVLFECNRPIVESLNEFISTSNTNNANVFLIQGENGNGTTHFSVSYLMDLMTKNSNIKIRMINAEELVCYFKSNKSNNDWELRRQCLADCDVLVIDDFQFLEYQQDVYKYMFQNDFLIEEDTRLILIVPTLIPVGKMDKLIDAFNEAYLKRWQLQKTENTEELDYLIKTFFSARGYIDIPQPVIERITKWAQKECVTYRDLQGFIATMTAYSKFYEVPITSKLAFSRALNHITDNGKRSLRNKKLYP